MKPIIIKGYKQLLKSSLFREGCVFFRQFPDKETYIRIDDDVHNRDVILLYDLSNTDEKILKILFLSETLRDLGAKSVGIILPYLPYMRQDKRFNSGEGITSVYFSKLISNYFDWLITIDPHLHRHRSLEEIYSIPSIVLNSASIISRWIKLNIKQPVVLIGPDIESSDQVKRISSQIGAPYIILEKTRMGDYDVKISDIPIDEVVNRIPILVDDIISTGKTMVNIVENLKRLNFKDLYCIATHALFIDKAYEDLKKSGVKEIVTCNTINHVTNRIDVSSLIESAIKSILKL